MIQSGTTVQGKIEIEIKSFLCLLSDIGIPCYVNSASCWHSFVCTIWIPIKDPPSQEPPFRQGSKRQSGTTVQGMIEIQYSLCNLSEFGIPLPHKSPHSGRGVGCKRQSGTTVQGMIEIQYFLCNLSDIGIPLPHKSPHSCKGVRDYLGLQCKEW